jgi:hypothetical protein
LSDVPFTVKISVPAVNGGVPVMAIRLCVVSVVSTAILSPFQSKEGLSTFDRVNVKSVKVKEVTTFTVSSTFAL